MFCAPEKIRDDGEIVEKIDHFHSNNSGLLFQKVLSVVYFTTVERLRLIEFKHLISFISANFQPLCHLFHSNSELFINFSKKLAGYTSHNFTSTCKKKIVPDLGYVILYFKQTLKALSHLLYGSKQLLPKFHELI